MTPNHLRRVGPKVGSRWQVSLLLSVLLTGTAFAEPWRFGVITDTQWWDGGNNPEKNPNTVSGEIIRQIQPRFIEAGVRFVIQTGDLSEYGGEAAVNSRAALAQPLFDSGIGFYPLRGNHDATQTIGLEFQKVFPQTQGRGPYVFGATNFSGPFPSVAGLSYSFDFNGARFVLLDQFVRTDGSTSLTETNLTSCDEILDQLPWINEQLSQNRSVGSPAFVFSHRNLLNQMHVDSLLGATPAANPAAQNAFISCLQTNGVRYAMGGHDHMHHRAIIASPDGRFQIEEIIASPASSRFMIPNGSPLTPETVPNDIAYNSPRRETPLAQECFSIGYYIFTVDGPRVNADYYSATTQPQLWNGSYGYLTELPVLDFKKKETFGYSLNGRQFLVPQGGSYTAVQDRIEADAGFVGTSMRILEGTNQSTKTDAAGRKLTKAIDTGWSCASHGSASDILTLWGLVDLGAGQADTYVLSMSFNPAGVAPEQLTNSLFCLATRTGGGPWVRAADAMTTETTTFVQGPWQPGYDLGTYGVDPATATAWAVVNQGGDFAVTEVIPTLTIRQNGSQLSLSWPQSPGYQLQSCRDISKGDWAAVVTDSPTGFMVPTDAPSQFFRLARP